jgi:hypothetical protein
MPQILPHFQDQNDRVQVRRARQPRSTSSSGRWSCAQDCARKHCGVSTGNGMESSLEVSSDVMVPIYLKSKALFPDIYVSQAPASPWLRGPVSPRLSRSRSSLPTRGSAGLPSSTGRRGPPFGRTTPTRRTTTASATAICRCSSSRTPIPTGRLPGSTRRRRRPSSKSISRRVWRRPAARGFLSTRLPAVHD